VPFKITFLGTGTSHGIPMIACSCLVCTSSNPKNKRFRTSILVEHDQFQFVMDTTPDFRSQCLRANVQRIDAVVYTHEHSDHLLGLDELRRFCSIQDSRIPVYGSSRVLEYIQRIFPYAVSTPPPYKGLPELDLHEIRNPFELGKFKMTPYKMPHGSTETFGFRFEDARGTRFAYLTDGKKISEEIRRDIRNIPLLILGVLRKTPHPTHLSVSEAMEVVEDIRPQKAFFVHMAHEIDHDSVNSELPENIRLAYDELILEI